MADALSSEQMTGIVQDALKAFPKETPGVYRWSVASVGFIIFAVVITTIVQPDVAGYVSCAVIFMILLIFILFNLEKSGPKAERQLATLSWFASAVLMGSTLLILSSLFWSWPLQISLAQDYDSPKFLARITEYRTVDSSFIRASDNTWKQTFLTDTKKIYSFEQRGLSPDFLLLHDDARKIFVRIPTHGGVAEWSINTNFDNCAHEYCWGDVGRATLHSR